MQKIPGGKLTKLDTRDDMQKQLDAFIELLPAALQYIPHHAKVTKVKYDALVAEGFTESQALEIVKVRPLFE